MSQSNPFLEQLGTIASVKTFINLRKKMIKLSKSSKITLIVLSRNHNQADDDYIIKQWVAWEQFDHYFIQVKFVEDSLKKIWSDMGCLSRPYYFKFLKAVFHTFHKLKWYGLHCLKSVRIRSFSGPYSVRMRENADQKNSKYGHFSRSAAWADHIICGLSSTIIWSIPKYIVTFVCYN